MRQYDGPTPLERGTRTTFQDRSGRTTGTATIEGNRTVFRDVSGRTVATATKSGHQTTYRERRWADSGYFFRNAGPGHVPQPPGPDDDHSAEGQDYGHSTGCERADDCDDLDRAQLGLGASRFAARAAASSGKPQEQSALQRESAMASPLRN